MWSFRGSSAASGDIYSLLTGEFPSFIDSCFTRPTGITGAGPWQGTFRSSCWRCCLVAISSARDRPRTRQTKSLPSSIAQLRPRGSMEKVAPICWRPSTMRHPYIAPDKHGFHSRKVQFLIFLSLFYPRLHTPSLFCWASSSFFLLPPAGKGYFNFYQSSDDQCASVGRAQIFAIGARS